MDEKEMRDIRSAADYLNMSIRAVRYHADTVKDLKPDGWGKHGRRLFTVATLDRFNQTRRRQGRPKGSGHE